MGLDIVTLGIKLNLYSFTPKLFNPYSISIFLDKLGFQTLEITTPGKLDIDILKNNKNILDNLLFKYIFKTSDEKYLKNLQNFISKFNLSSHMMIVCKKMKNKNTTLIPRMASSRLPGKPLRKINGKTMIQIV